MAANRSLSYYDPVSSAVGNLIETHEHTGDFEELLITRLIFPVNGSRGFYNNGLLKGDIMKAAVINAPNHIDQCAWKKLQRIEKLERETFKDTMQEFFINPR